MAFQDTGSATLDALRCACGETILHREQTTPNPNDVRVTCDACERGYVVTITPFRGPQVTDP